MPTSYAHYGPTHPVLGALAERVSRPLLRAYAARYGFQTPDSAYARERGTSFAEKLRRGERVYLAGIGPAGHNSGVALVEASRVDGIRLICNNEEERYTGVRHCTTWPEQSLHAALTTLASIGIEPGQIYAFVASWDYVTLAATLVRSIVEELPASRVFLRPQNFAPMNASHIARAFRSPQRTRAPTGAASSHADHRHAASRQPRLFLLCGVAVCRQRRAGDDQCTGRHRRRWRDLALPGAGQRGHAGPPQSRHLRLAGGFYSMISSTQGGWTILSSEGRFMGSAAWGDGERLTNPYYRQLRELFHFAADGTVRLNRALANWPRSLQARPYTKALHDIIGPPIPLDAMWNPYAVMRVDVASAEVDSQARFDKAAATQLVFEDALFHIVGHLMRTTGSRRLVLTGGTALNAIANMRMLDQHPDLHIWVPPVPSDAGVPVGAAYHFALSNGAPLGEKLRHAFHCGVAPGDGAIEAALRNTGEIGWERLSDDRGRIADLLACCIAQDGVLGLFQGPAGDRTARARPSIDPRQSLQSADAGNHQPAGQVPRAVPSARADAHAGGRASLVRFAGRCRGRRLQCLQLHGADRPAARGRDPPYPCGGSPRQHQPHPDRARGH